MLLFLRPGRSSVSPAWERGTAILRLLTLPKRRSIVCCDLQPGRLWFRPRPSARSIEPARHSRTITSGRDSSCSSLYIGKFHRFRHSANEKRKTFPLVDEAKRLWVYTVRPQPPTGSIPTCSANSQADSCKSLHCTMNFSPVSRCVR